MTKVQWEFAVMDGLQLVDVADTAAEAADIAGIPEGFRANPYYGVTPGAVRDLDELTDLPEGKTSGVEAFERSGLSQVSGHEVLEMTDGLQNPDRVYATLQRFFDHLDTENWRSPEGLIKSMLGGNEKVNMPDARVKGTIKGLTLVPFWRNTQDYIVRDAPNDKRVLKQIEEEFDIGYPPGSGKISHIPATDNWCVGSSWACRRACLIGTGNNYTQMSFRVKFAKAMALKEEPAAFCAALAMACNDFSATEIKAGRQAFIRLNMLSDIPWEIVFPDLFEMVPDAQFYDYTKVNVSKRMLPHNYDLTFSFNGTNPVACRQALQAGHRIATVFVSPDPKRNPANKKKRVSFAEAQDVFGDSMHDVFGAKGTFPFVNGNDSDFRPADPQPSVVFLSYKGPKGVSKEDKAEIRYKSKFAVPTDAKGYNILQVVPVVRVGGALLTAHTPLQDVFVPVETDAA